MTYQLRDIFNPSEVIADSDNIADLWQALDKQHFMLIPSLVITKGNEIVAGEQSLLPKMKKAQEYNVYNVASII